MKHEKLHTEIQELYNEITYMKGLLSTMSHQIQDLHDNIEKNNKLHKAYKHPWYEFTS